VRGLAGVSKTNSLRACKSTGVVIQYEIPSEFQAKLTIPEQRDPTSLKKEKKKGDLIQEQKPNEDLKGQAKGMIMHQQSVKSH